MLLAIWTLVGAVFLLAAATAWAVVHVGPARLWTGLLAIGDSGLPLPLLRKDGRPDLVASVVLAVTAIVLLLMLVCGVFGGADVALGKPGDWYAVHWIVPALATVGAFIPLATTALLPVLLPYIVKRKHDVDAGVGPSQEDAPAPRPQP